MSREEIRIEFLTFWKSYYGIIQVRYDGSIQCTLILNCFNMPASFSNSTGNVVIMTISAIGS